MGEFVKLFFSPTDPGRNLSIGGINLKLHNGDRIHVWFRFGDVISDELAGSNQLYGLKGASGLKCCRWCSNVFNAKTTRDISHAFAVLHDCPTVRKFHLRTPASIDAVVDRIRSQHSVMGVDALKELQTALGFGYNLLGVLYDDFLRPIMNPADHSIPDWMHVFFVGGVVNRT